MSLSVQESKYITKKIDISIKDLFYISGVYLTFFNHLNNISVCLSVFDLLVD